ncbi:MAG: sugar ABC transporter permease [Verrucomicrobia bacterium]|nr:sugar ABC transporter permease [Verrucomicrobiota bacterium]
MATKPQIALYLMPATILVLTFFVFPLLFIVYMSFHGWAGLGPATYVGLDNFAYLARDKSFQLALSNTLMWVIAGTFIHTPLCILVALILARRPFMWKLFRTIFFLPNVISATAIALLWYFLYHINLGLINRGLTAAGLGKFGRAWLFDPNSALGATMLPWIIYIGFGMVIFLTQISTIPRELYEAAQLDGATLWEQDWHITIPLIKRAIAMQVLFVVGYALRMFEYPFIMTNGGPANRTINLSLYIYRQMITANQYGLSMAAGVVTLIVGAVLLSAIILVLKRVES